MSNLGPKSPYLGCYLFPEHSGESYIYTVNAIGKTAMIVQATCKRLSNGGFIPVRKAEAEEKILAMDELEKRYVVMTASDVAHHIPWEDIIRQD